MDILIVNRRQYEHTRNLLEDLNRQTVNDFTVSLVENDCESRQNCISLYAIPHYPLQTESIYYNQDLNKLWNQHFITSNDSILSYLNNDIRITPNFVKDTLEVFKKEPRVGIVIHVTNNLNYTKETSLSYGILEEPLCQGWDFSIRKEAFVEIPEEIRIFGGDDWLFTNAVKNGWQIAMVFSSPIIHHKEVTRKANPEVSIIQKEDHRQFMKLIEIHNLKIIPNTVTTGICNRFVPDGMTPGEYHD